MTKSMLRRAGPLAVLAMMAALLAFAPAAGAEGVPGGLLEDTTSQPPTVNEPEPEPAPEPEPEPEPEPAPEPEPEASVYAPSAVAAYQTCQRAGCGPIIGRIARNLEPGESNPSHRPADRCRVRNRGGC